MRTEQASRCALTKSMSAHDWYNDLQNEQRSESKHADAPVGDIPHSPAKSAPTKSKTDTAGTAAVGSTEAMNLPHHQKSHGKHRESHHESRHEPEVETWSTFEPGQGHRPVQAVGQTRTTQKSTTNETVKESRWVFYTSPSSPRSASQQDKD